jgi:hypothetical protein
MAFPEVLRDPWQAGGDPAVLGRDGNCRPRERRYGLIDCRPFIIGLHEFWKCPTRDVLVSRGTPWTRAAGDGCA